MYLSAEGGYLWAEERWQQVDIQGCEEDSEVGETDKDVGGGICEELSTEISVDEFLCTVEYDYPKFHLTMHCYLCLLMTDSLLLNEHEAAKWLTKDELNSVKWLPADAKLISHLRCLKEERRC